MKNGSPILSFLAFTVILAALLTVFSSCGCSNVPAESSEETQSLSTDVDPSSGGANTWRVPGPDETLSPDETSETGETSESGDATDGTTVTGKSGGETSKIAPETDKGGKEIHPSTEKTPETQVPSTSGNAVTDLPEPVETVPENFDGMVFEVRADKKTVRPGDKLTLQVDVVQNPGFYVMVVDLGRASGNLKLDGITYVETSEFYCTAKVRAVLDSRKYADCKYTGNILTFEFTVSENAVPGKYKLTGSCDCATMKEERVKSFFILPTIEITKG